MKSLMIAAAALLLTGCATKPTPRPFEIGGQIDLGGSSGHTVIEEAKPVKMPDLPAALAKRAGRLPDLTDPTVSGQQLDGVATDRLYNDVAHQLNAVIDLWSCVKQALETKTPPDACLKDK